MNHGVDGQGRGLRRLSITFIALVFIGVIAWLVWGRDRDGSHSVESRINRVFARVRWEEQRGQRSLGWLYWLEAQKARIFKKEPRAQNPGMELQVLGTEAFPALSKALLSDRSLAVRKLAAETLGNLADTRSVSSLTNRLCLEINAELRQVVARSLSQAGSPNSLPAALCAFQRETNELVLEEIAGLLGTLGDRQAVPLLIGVLAADPVVGSAAARALGEIGDASAIPALLQAARSNTLSQSQPAIISVLGQFGGEEVRSFLLEAVTNAASTSLRQEAARALATQRGGRDVARLLGSAFRDEKDAGVRAELVEVLQGTRDPIAKSVLTHAATQDPDENVRSAAMRALAVAAGTEAVPVLLSALERETKDNVRERAASALEEWAGPEAFSGLISMLERTNPPHVEELAAQTLGEWGLSAALPLLLSNLSRTKPEEARLGALRGLGRLGDRRAVEPLLALAQADPSMAVRQAACEALGLIGDRVATPVLIRIAETNMPVSVADRSSVFSTRNEPDVRGTAVEALSQLRDPRALPLFLAAARADKDATVRRGACEGLGNLAAFPGVEVLRWALERDRDSSVQTAAAEALGRIGGDRALGVLSSALQKETEDFSLRLSIIRSLGWIGNTNAIPVLVRQFDTGTTFGSAAAEALGSIGDPAGIPFLLPLLHSDRKELRAAAVEALAQLGASEAVPILKEMLRSDRSGLVRTKAALGLGFLGEFSAEPLLQSAMDDKESEVRFEAAWSLGHLASTNSQARLTAALNDKEGRVRFAAAYSLVEINDASVIPFLRNNLVQMDQYARLATAAALTMLGDVNGLETLRESIHCRDKWRRFAAVLALARCPEPSAKELLKSASEDAAPAIRCLAVSGQDAKGTASSLTQILRDSDRDMRMYAARALIFFNDPSTIPALRDACKDPDAEVRAAARLTLRRVQRFQ